MLKWPRWSPCPDIVHTNSLVFVIWLITGLLAEWYHAWGDYLFYTAPLLTTAPKDWGKYLPHNHAFASYLSQFLSIMSAKPQVLA